MADGFADRDPAVSDSIEVDAPVSDVWAAWTTEAGVRSFFAPACSVEARSGGPYEIYFYPDAPEGERGAEGCVVLAVQSGRMLSFTWNAPTDLPSVREQRTVVVVRLRPLEDDRTLVSLVHGGFGVGGEWDDAVEYFRSAWGGAVLPRLARRFTEGPVDWD